MFRIAIVLALASGCGNGAGAPDPQNKDSGPDSPVIVDARPDARALEYYQPRLISELNTSLDERSPVLADDGRALYFGRTELHGSLYINVAYVARRANTASRFNAAVRAVAFGAISLNDFEMSNDELEWHYWRGLGQLAKSTRASSDDGWSAPVNLGFDGFSPSLDASRRRLIYIALSGDVLLRERASPIESWQTPRLVALPLAEPIEAVDFSRDALLLLITTKSGIWLARRDGLEQAFADIVFLFEGQYEDARFGADEQLISMIDNSETTRQMAIATRQP